MELAPRIMFGMSRKSWYSGSRDFMTRIGTAISIGLGLCFGAALGAAMQSAAVGVVFAAAIGVAFSMIFGGASPEASARKQAASDKPMPHPLGL